MNKRLPTEVLLLVQSHSQRGWAWRGICTVFLEVPDSVYDNMKDAVYPFMINLAARDGQLALLQWAVKTFQLQDKLSSSWYYEYPAAFAIECGHLDIVKYIYTELLSIREATRMVISIPVAIRRRHNETVTWLFEQLDAAGHFELVCGRSLEHYRNIMSTGDFRKITTHCRSRDEHLFLT